MNGDEPTVHSQQGEMLFTSPKQKFPFSHMRSPCPSTVG